MASYLRTFLIQTFVILIVLLATPFVRSNFAADPDCDPPINILNWIVDLTQQFTGLLESAEYLPSHCDALSAATRIYQIRGWDHILKNESDHHIHTDWVNCDKYKDLLFCRAAPTPTGYRLTYAYAGPRGTQLAVFQSDQGKPPILAIAGTQNQLDWYANLQAGAGQVVDLVQMKVSPDSKGWSSSADIGGGIHDHFVEKFQRAKASMNGTLISNLADSVAKGQDLIITGHSLGGAIAQSAGYLIQEQVDKQTNSPHGQIHVYTWNGLGAHMAFDTLKYPLDEKIIRELHIENYRARGDIVPDLGPQLGGGNKILFPPRTSWHFSYFPFLDFKYHSINGLSTLISECKK